MTLTEEQREAIRVISKLPMAIGCQLCHPYIMKNYGRHFIVLRDMIDSSGTVEPTGGFDLERARVEVDTASARRFSESREQARIFCAEEILPDALDEIERLRAENEEALESLTAAYLLGRHEKAQEVAARPKEGKIDSSEHVTEPTKMIGFDLEKARAVDIDLLATTDWGELRARYRAALAEIERLRADNAGLSKTVIDIQEERDLAQAEFRAYHKAWEEQAARIKELEDALVEGLTNFLHYRASCYDPARRCPYAKECDDCSTWDACGHVEMFRSEARRQLQAEGEIGPDAHLRPYEVVAADLAGRLAEDRRKSWQITEERVGLLEYCLETLLDAPDIEEIPGPGHSIEVLRAMLREAE